MKQNLMIAILMTAILIGILPMVTPAATLVFPASYTNHTETMAINVTFINSSDIVNPILANSTLYCNTSGTWSVITMTSFSCYSNGNFTDAVPEECVATVDVDALTDTLSMACNISLGNVSGVINATDSSPNIEITIDSTDPICGLDLGHKHIAWKGIQQVEWTSSDALELMRTAVSIDGPEDQTTLSYTDANRDLTLTSQDTKYLGEWSVLITGYDRPGNTCTITETFKSYLPEDLPDDIEIPKAPGLLLIAIIAVVGYFIFIKKK